MAEELFNKGAMLVFLDVPEGTEFGIDCKSWQVGPKFKGLKMIPPGIHFVYYSAMSKDLQIAPRTGFFYNFSQQEVLVKKWDKNTEDISDEAVSTEQQQKLETSKYQLDPNLGTYPFESYKKWVSLTSHLQPEFLSKLLPDNGKICSVAQFESHPSTSQSRAADVEKLCGMEATPLDSGLPHLDVIAETRIHWTSIPRQTYPEGCRPEEVTQHSLDHSYCLQQLMESAFSNCKLNILAELQFAFILFFIGNVYTGFDQWKKLLRLLCMSDDALCSYVELYEQFITTLHYQVHEIPDDFFVDIVSQDNFLVTLLHTFFVNLSDSDTSNNLKEKGQRFKNHLEKKFNWNFSADIDDNCPVIEQKFQSNIPHGLAKRAAMNYIFRGKKFSLTFLMTLPQHCYLYNYPDTITCRTKLRLAVYVLPM